MTDMESTIKRVKILPEANLPLVSEEVLKSLKEPTKKVSKVLTILKQAFTLAK
jgi:hypothetical protein